MKRSILAAVLAALVLWLILSWFVPDWLHLASPNSWILRIALMVIGLLGAIASIWLLGRGEPARADASSTAAQDLDQAFSEASARLRSANIASGKIGALPLVLLIGDHRSAKTTVILRSGLEPELLAGQAYAGEDVTPTRNLNIWLARQTIFLDPGAALLGDSAARLRLAHALAPSAASSLGKAESAARSALVCLDCEEFLKPGAAESLAAKARQIREHLAEFAAALGISLPVYVLFTKLDRIAHFFQYAANLNDREAQAVFGTTLPFKDAAASGAYADRAAQRFSDAFTTLYASLCDRRLIHLTREQDRSKLPGVYEFPREFRKIRSLLIQFLVDVSRPSQLQVSPILRGFYFTGVRPVTIADVVQAPSAPPKAQAFDPEATRVFLQPQQAAAPTPLHNPGSRRVPQWVYLANLFPGVILSDRAALQSSRKSVKTGKTRRLALIAACAAGLFLAGAWSISFLSNRQLVGDAAAAATIANSASPAGNGLAPTQSLQNLEQLRSRVSKLVDYQANGIPLHLRWGLYTGDEVLEPLYRSWFAAFQKMLLRPTQTDLVNALAQPSSSSGGGYLFIYNALKAYLITTSNPEKSSRAFLPPVLVASWQNGRALEPVQRDLASREFDFYSGELVRRHPWPYATTSDEDAVTTARKYLQRLSGNDSLYQSVLASVNQEAPLVFKTLYPEAERVVVNAYPVPAAFTKTGWAAVQKAIRNIGEYIKGEEWVLGPEATRNVDRKQLQSDLDTRYRNAFLQYWREYLNRTSVRPFANVKDAADKLDLLSGNKSPLLEVLCLASENTSFEGSPALDVFQPTRQLVPPGCKDHPSSPANDSYMQSLIALQGALKALSTDESNDALRTDALSKATAADVAVQQIARNFTPDKSGHVDSTTKSIVEAPIKYVQSLLAGVPKQEANAAARGFCTQFNAVASKYPFSASPQSATLDEVGSIFRPNDGALWKLYQQNLQKSLLIGGTSFYPRPGADPAPSPAFLSFLNRAALISNALYHGAAQPHLSFSLRVIPDEAVESVALTINGQTLNYSAANTAARQFEWPGTGPEEAKLSVKFAGNADYSDFSPYTGSWAMFRFFDDLKNWQPNGTEYTMEKPITSSGGPVYSHRTGRPEVVRFAISSGMSTPLFKPGSFRGLPCVPAAFR